MVDPKDHVVGSYDEDIWEVSCTHLEEVVSSLDVGM